MLNIFIKSKQIIKLARCFYYSSSFRLAVKELCIFAFLPGEVLQNYLADYIWLMFEQAYFLTTD